MKVIVTNFGWLLLFMLLSTKCIVALEMSDFVSGFLLSQPTPPDIYNMDYHRHPNFIEIASVTTACCQESQGINLNIAEDNTFNPISGVMPESSWLMNNTKIQSDDTATSNDTSGTNQPSPPIDINPNSHAALQNQSTQKAFDIYQGVFSVPLRPSKDVEINVNQQKIQVNIN